MDLIENTGRHIHGAIGSVKCATHGKPAGEPCYILDNNSGMSENPFHFGICGKRITAAGFVGKISPESMRKRPPVRKTTDGDRKPFKKTAARRQLVASK